MKRITYGLQIIVCLFGLSLATAANASTASTADSRLTLQSLMTGDLVLAQGSGRDRGGRAGRGGGRAGGGGGRAGRGGGRAGRGGGRAGRGGGRAGRGGGRAGRGGGRAGRGGGRAGRGGPRARRGGGRRGRGYGRRRGGSRFILHLGVGGATVYSGRYFICFNRDAIRFSQGYHCTYMGAYQNISSSAGYHCGRFYGGRAISFGSYSAAQGWWYNNCNQWNYGY